MVVNQVFGFLVVVSQVGKQKKWLCRCACGASKIVKQNRLESGHTKSCGCARHRHVPEMTACATLANRKLAIGMRFGRLVIKQCYPTFALCDCGKEKFIINSSLLFAKKTQSCGCLNSDTARLKLKRRLEKHRVAHGFGPTEAMACANRAMRNLMARAVTPLVLARDDYTCLLCGERGKMLNAHHIVPWAENTTLRLKLTNLATLCRSCHIDVAHQGNVHGPVCADTQLTLQAIVRQR